MSSFVHLHVHSEYSLLDGFSNIKKLVKRAKEMDMPALALTDHGTMFGVIDFYNTATAAGVKPIIGVEAYLAANTMKQRDPQRDKRSTHLLLLAENETGYKNLLKIASAAQLEGFYYYPRIDHEFLAEHNEGLICTSGCMSAEVPRMIQNGDLEGARRQLDWYYEVFDKDRFFLELQAHDIKELEAINKNLVQLGRRYDAKFVATNDVHYVDKDDARLQDILLAIQTGCVLADPNRMRMTDNSYYLRSPHEMEALFSGVPGALENTLLIAERCSVDLGFKGYRLPHFDVPAGHDAESYLRKLCEEGLERRYGVHSQDKVVRDRLNYELGIIHQMGFDAYFLIVWDLCQYAAKNGIWYNARGSAAGSIVAYTLDITMVDPIDHGLIFERFLNPGRVSMPDIDLDFPDDRRAEMMEYTARKYGDDKVAQIITFGTLGARAAIRDVGRVMDIPLPDVDKVAKLIPNVPGKPVSIEMALEEVPDLKQIYKNLPHLRDLIDTAKHMEGVVRNAGTHAAGVIITDKPIIEYIPLHRPTGSSAADSPVKTVTQFEMSILDALGLLKVDFLGLATLTIMARACNLIRERHGIHLDLYNIPTDDPETYDLLGRGETAGVFQVEGSGMRRWLVEMKPKELANVIAMVALFRPGPMDFIPGYIRRMHGEEQIEYRHPSLEKIFKETYGYPVYQEQLMFAAMDLAGYTASEADGLRKAIAKKKKAVLEKHREKFIAGAVKNGMERETAKAIFTDWEEFARYGFNKSHAVDYGVIAVQTAYLKTHYPVEYMTAVLSVNQNDSDKVALYVADCRRMEIDVQPPDVNISNWDFTIEDRSGEKPNIRFGLGAIKNVGQGPVTAILEARKDEPFQDLNEFTRRVDLRHVGKRALESMIRVGALDRFGPRTALLEAIDRIMAVSTSNFKAAEMGQMSLFGAHTGVVEEIILPEASSEISRREVLNWERELIGLYVSDHPLNPVMNELQDIVSHFSGQLAEVQHDERVRVAGLITRIRHHTTKSGKPMAFASLEDLQGNVELVLFPRTWARYSEMIDYDKILLVEGKVDNAGGGDSKILVDSIATEFSKVTSIDSPPAPPPYYMPDWVDTDTPDEPDFPETEPSAPYETAPATQHKLGESSSPVQPAGASPDVPKQLPVAKAQPPAEKTHAQEESEPVHPAAQPASVQPSSAKLSPEQSEPKTVKLAPDPSQSQSVEVEWGGPPPPEAFPDGWNDFYDAVELPEGDLQVDMPMLEPALEASQKAQTDRNKAQGEKVLARPAATQSTASSRSTLAEARAMPSKPQSGPTATTTAVSESRAAIRPETQAMAELPSVDPSADDYPAANLPAVDGSENLTTLSETQEDDQTVYMLTIVLRSTGDKARDVLRLRRIYGIISSYPGRDRFGFRVFERGRGYLLEFPNTTAGVSPDLIGRLNALVGSDNVLVEPLVFQ